MNQKMSFAEKVCEIVAFSLIIFSIIIKCILGAKDSGTFVILAFLGIMLFVIFLVCAFFPADWRMTEKQKEKIRDMKLYQGKYRKVLVGVNVVFSIFSSCLILLCS